MKALQAFGGQGLPTGLTSACENHPVLRVICGQHFESPGRCWLLGWDYCYNSVATQIPHDAGKASILYTAENSLPTGDRTSTRSTISKHIVLKRMPEVTFS